MKRTLVCAVTVLTLSFCANAIMLAPPFLVTSDYFGPMRQVDIQTGSMLGTLSGGYEAGEIDLGPDGLIYASFARSSEIRMVDPVSGVQTGTIPLPGGPRDVTFGPEGHLYIAVAGKVGSGIYRFDPSTQQLSSRFNTSLLNGSPTGIAFGPGDDLFVCLDGRNFEGADDSVVRIDGKSGDFESVVTTENIYIPQSLAFGPDGNMYVGNQVAGTITSYTPYGLYLGTIAAGTPNPQGLYFLPDGDLAWGGGGSDFMRYDFQSDSLTTLSSGYSFAMGMVMVPEPTTLLLLGLGGLILRNLRTGRAGKT